MKDVDFDELEKTIRQPEPMLEKAMSGRRKLEGLLSIDKRPVPRSGIKITGPSRADILYMGIRRGAKTLVAAIPAAAGVAALLTAKGVSIPVAAGAGIITAVSTAIGAGAEKGLKELNLSKGKKTNDPLTGLLKLIKLILELFIQYRTQKPQGGDK